MITQAFTLSVGQLATCLTVSPSSGGGRRSRPPLAKIAIVAALALLGAGCDSHPAAQQEPARPAVAAPATVFPLHVEPGKRFLVDAAGNPFLLQGDTAWSLIAQASDAEVETYLDDRRRRGFNTILVNLIEHHYASHPPENAAGESPFRVPGDFSTPNDPYFAHADWVLRQAADRGF